MDNFLSRWWNRKWTTTHILSKEMELIVDIYEDDDDSSAVIGTRKVNAYITFFLKEDQYGNRTWHYECRNIHLSDEHSVLDKAVTDVKTWKHTGILPEGVTPVAANS